MRFPALNHALTHSFTRPFTRPFTVSFSLALALGCVLLSTCVPAFGAEPDPPVAVDGFHPTDLPGVRFFAESHSGVSVATCDTQECRDAGESAPLELHYCDLTAFPDGCVRRWQDQSAYAPSLGFEPPEWTTGRDFGQDDLDKPGVVVDCINGLPCIRGGVGETQDLTLEIEPGQDVDGITGPFSIVVLARPRAQSDDAYLFGFAGSELSRRTDDSYRARIAFGTTVTVAPPGAVSLDAWHVFELHRDAADGLRLVVDGVDVTEGAPVAPGELRFRFLLSVSRVRPFHGDVALALVVDGALDEAQRQELRGYVIDVFGVPAPPPPGATAAWSFDDDPTDCVLAAETGPVATRGPACPGNAPSTVPGVRGSALHFDGDDDEATVGADPALAAPAAFTLAAWVRCSPDSTWRSIYDHRDSRNDGYDLYIDPDGNLLVRANKKTFSAAPAEARVDDGAWHHVAGSYDGDELRLYVDGASLGSSGIGATSIDVSSPAAIGRNYRSGISVFDGTIDELGVWDRALDPAEIAALAVP